MTLTPGDPRLLTPGPLTTSVETKEAMLHDWGSRDQAFIDTNARVRTKLLENRQRVGHPCLRAIAR